MEAAASRVRQQMADSHLIDEADAWYVADAIPAGTTAAVALLEHRWAIPLRDAIIDQGGIVLADEWIHARTWSRSAPSPLRLPDLDCS